MNKPDSVWILVNETGDHEHSWTELPESHQVCYLSREEAEEVAAETGYEVRLMRVYAASAIGSLRELAI